MSKNIPPKLVDDDPLCSKLGSIFVKVLNKTDAIINTSGIKNALTKAVANINSSAKK